MPDNIDQTVLTVVCTGNICRSPMGEVMLRDYLEDQGVTGVTVNSCGMAGYHVGGSADSRAIAQLASDGHDGSKHVASQFGPEFDDSTAFLAMDQGHASQLISEGVDPSTVFLFRAFDPDSWNGAIDSHEAPEVDDPYYGTEEDFTRVAREVSAALPGIAKHFAPQ